MCGVFLRVYQTFEVTERCWSEQYRDGYSELERSKMYYVPNNSIVFVMEELALELVWSEKDRGKGFIVLSYNILHGWEFWDDQRIRLHTSFVCPFLTPSSFVLFGCLSLSHYKPVYHVNQNIQTAETTLYHHLFSPLTSFSPFHHVQARALLRAVAVAFTPLNKSY